MTVKITKGVAKTLNCIARNESDNTPKDLTGVTTMNSCFIKTDGSSLDINGLTTTAIQITATLTGSFSILLSASVTSLLAEGTKDFYAELNPGTTTAVPIPFSNQLRIVSKPC